MSLIGSIRTIGDKLAGRKFNQWKNRPAGKKPHPDSSATSNELHGSGEYDLRLGRKLDTTA